MNAIAHRLKNLRDGKNLTQGNVAEYLGIPQQRYSRYENGKSELPSRHLEALSKLYGVSSDYILGISTSENDLISVSNNIYGNIPFKDILNDIASLDAKQISKLSDYIKFLKYEMKIKTNELPVSGILIRFSKIYCSL